MRRSLVFLLLGLLFANGFVLYGQVLFLLARRAQEASGSEATYAIAGQMGDMFGAFSAFFNGLALIFVAYSVYQQNKQLAVENSAQVVEVLEIFNRRWTTPPMLYARRLMWVDYMAENKGFSQPQQYVAEFFEHVAIFVSTLKVDDVIVWELYSYYIEGYWSAMEESILEIRKKDTSAFSRFMALRTMMAECTQLRYAAVYTTDEVASAEAEAVALQLKLIAGSSGAVTPPSHSHQMEAIDNPGSSGTLKALWIVTLLSIALSLFQRARVPKSGR